MSNIEECVKTIKYRVDKCREEFEDFGEISFAYSDLDRIENILSEREQDKKRIKKLEEENRIYALNGSNIELEMHIKNNYIPKQKVKDLIENETINISGFECIAVEDLEELLEEK